MQSKRTLSRWVAALAFFALGVSSRISAQTPAPQTPAKGQQHVVSVQELNQATERPAQTRQENEAAIRDLLNTEAGQEALKTAKVDYARVDKAVGQLSDEDLEKIAARSRQAQADFAAGGLTSTLIIVIVLIVVLAVVLSVVF